MVVVVVMVMVTPVVMVMMTKFNSNLSQSSFFTQPRIVRF
jgi:hypothetical protein